MENLWIVRTIIITRNEWMAEPIQLHLIIFGRPKWSHNKTFSFNSLSISANVWEFFQPPEAAIITKPEEMCFYTLIYGISSQKQLRGSKSKLILAWRA